MSHGGGGAEKCRKSVTCYLNGPLSMFARKTLKTFIYLILYCFQASFLSSEKKCLLKHEKMHLEKCTNCGSENTYDI
jgi:hypothetical protein